MWAYGVDELLCPTWDRTVFPQLSTPENLPAGRRVLLDGSVGRFTGNTGCSSPPVWRCNQSIIPDVLGIIVSAVHRTRRQKNRGLGVFPVALWLQILIKCLNDFPACSFSQILLTGGKWVLSKYFWGHLKSFAGFCLWMICFSSMIHLCFLPEYVCVLKASHKP